MLVVTVSVAPELTVSVAALELELLNTNALADVVSERVRLFPAAMVIVPVTVRDLL